jgi:site-specific recombinase XerD
MLEAEQQPTKPLEELVTAFLQRKRLADKSRRDYTKYLHEYVAFTRNGDVTALTLDSAIRWRHDLLGRSPWVARLGTSILRSFAKWLAQGGYLRDPNGRSVLLGLEGTTTTTRKRHTLTDEQLDAIWAALAERRARDRLRGIAYVRLLHATGLRKVDVHSILLRNLNTATRWLTVAVNRKTRTEMKRVRMDRHCVKAVEDYLASDERPAFRGRPPEPLFLTEDGDAFTYYGFASRVGRVGDDIERLTGIPWNSELMRFTWILHQRSKIRDSDLRRRCADLLAADSDHDRAISAATIVLEDRVRERSGGAAGLIGNDLMTWAFDGPKPRIPLADHPTEQWGALNVYRGMAAFYRNGTAHRVRAEDFDPDEAARIVAWVDHLLGLID